MMVEPFSNQRLGRILNHLSSVCVCVRAGAGVCARVCVKQTERERAESLSLN